MIFLPFGDRRNFAAEPLHQIRGFLPGPLNTPYRCADEIFRHTSNPEIFVENKNTLLP